MKIKIMAVLTALIVGVGCLGVCEFKAYSDGDIVSFEYDGSVGYSSDCLYSRTIRCSSMHEAPSGMKYSKDKINIFYSDSPIYHLSLREVSDGEGVFNNYDIVFSESPLNLSYHSDDGGATVHTRGNVSEYKATMSDGRTYYVSEVYCMSMNSDLLSFEYENAADFVVHVDSASLDEDDAFKLLLSSEMFPPKVFIYDASLGYLNNLVKKSLVLTDSVGNQDMSSIKELISFDSLSTSGVDLTSGEYSIRVYEQVCYYKGHSSEVFKDDYELVKIGDFPIDNSSISYLSSDAFNITTDNTELLSGWDIFWNNAVRSDNKYYQIIKTNDDGSVEYGGYVKLSCLPDGSGYYATTVTPEHDTDIENGGYIGDDVENGLGSGTNYGDAELDANESLSGNADSVISDVYGVDEFVSTMSGLAGMVGAFPMVLGALFGFLPSWCLGLIASAFALLVALIIYKCVRG